MTGGGGIASLIPSGTDIVAALGLGDRLVGVSHECDHPIAAGRPVLTASTLGEDLGPAEVDAAVSASVAAGESLYRTDAALLARLAPAIVLSQDVCDVCAVNGEMVRGEVPDGATLIMLSAVRLAHLWEDLRRVAEAAGVPADGEALVAECRARLDRVTATVGFADPVRVAAVEWGDPLFAAGHWVPELVELAGGVDVLGEVGMASRRVTAEEVRAAEPDVVVFLPCGYGVGAAAAEGRHLAAGLDLDVPVWAVDATSLFSRCTPEAVTRGAEVLAGILHPGRVGPPDRSRAVRVDDGQARQTQPARSAGA